MVKIYDNPSNVYQDEEGNLRDKETGQSVKGGASPMSINDYFVQTYREAIQKEYLNARLQKRPVNTRNIALYEHCIRKIEGHEVNLIK